jgi:type IV pilus assembly protein PilF
LATLLLAACTSAGPARMVAGDAALERARAHTELAAAYYQAGQQATAAAEAQAALHAAPDYAPAHNVYGLVLMATGQTAQADAAFARAVALDPQDADARNNRAVLLCRSGRIDDAVREWDTAARTPYYATPAQSWRNAAACLAGAGRTSESQTWRDRAASAAPAAGFSTARPSDLTAGGVGPNVAR